MPVKIKLDIFQSIGCEIDFLHDFVHQAMTEYRYTQIWLENPLRSLFYHVTFRTDIESERMYRYHWSKKYLRRYSVICMGSGSLSLPPSQSMPGKSNVIKIYTSKCIVHIDRCDIHFHLLLSLSHAVCHCIEIGKWVECY